MRTYSIKGVSFEYDESLQYLDFFVNPGPNLVEIRWDTLLEAFRDGKIQAEQLEYEMVMLDRWHRDVPRKRFYRKMVKEGFGVLSGEYWFENMPDEKAEEIFTGLTNSAVVARKFLETFLPAVAEKCKQEHHPAEKYYIDP